MTTPKFLNTEKAAELLGIHPMTLKMTEEAIFLLKDNVFQVNKKDGSSFDIIVTEI